MKKLTAWVSTLEELRYKALKHSHVSSQYVLDTVSIVNTFLMEIKVMVSVSSKRHHDPDGLQVSVH